MMTPIRDADTATARRICGVSRGRACVRAALLTLGAVLLMMPAVLGWPQLRFAPSPASNRLTDYAWAVILGLPFLIGAGVALSALRWWLLVVWPGTIGVDADGKGLHLRLGPFGRRTLDWPRMNISYYYERADDPEEPPDPDRLALEPREEVESLLPRMRHPAVSEDVRWTLRRFAAAEESRLAAALSPYLLTARAAQGHPVVFDEDEDESGSHGNAAGGGSVPSQ